MNKLCIFTLCSTIAYITTNTSCKKPKDPIPVTPTSDSANVLVNNGYGSGKYKIGDTVHIFNNPLATTELFDKWNGDNTLLKNNDEWHTYFIMPSSNVNLTGTVKPSTTFTLINTMIKGKTILKPVYYYLPSTHKGIAYLLHGSGGTAQNLVNDYEWQQLIKVLVTDGYGIVVTECEEATLGMDTNGDGKLRWLSNPLDSVANIDLANIKAISDTIYARGWSTKAKPRYAVGMSNGGNYSTIIAPYFKFKTAVSYCAQSGALTASISNVPTQFCMAKFDNNDNVGQAGNIEALNNSQAYTNRGICSKYLMKERAPLYSERFARNGTITIAKSIAVFNELKTKGFLNTRNYFIGYSDAFVNAYQTAPGNYPEFNTLTILQKLFVLQQIDLSVSDHQFYSDFNNATLKYMNTQCL